MPKYIFLRKILALVWTSFLVNMILCLIKGVYPSWFVIIAPAVMLCFHVWFDIWAINYARTHGEEVKAVINEEFSDKKEE